MKLTKNGGNLVVTDIDITDIIRILKVDIPCKLTFIKSNSIDESQTIELFERKKINKNSTIYVASKEKKKMISGFDYVMKLIETRKDLGYQMICLFDINSLSYGQGEIIKLLPKLSTQIVMGCAYITFEENPNRYEIHYLNINGNLPCKSIYYVENNSMLAFTDNAPILITDNPKLTSIADFLCE